MNRMSTHEVSFDFEGNRYSVVFRVTSWGSAAHMGSLTYPGDPGDPVEWEVESYWLEQKDADAVQVFDGTPVPEGIERAAEIAIEAKVPDLDPADDSDIDWIL